MGEITIASTSDTPNQVREALGLPAVNETPNPGNDDLFVASAEIVKSETPAPPAEVPPPVPPPTPPPTDGGDNGDDADDPDAEAASEAGRTLAARRSAQGRIQRMLLKETELKEKLSAKDAETAELRSRLDALETGRVTANPAAPPPAAAEPEAPPQAQVPTFAEQRPKSDDFPDYEAYELAKEDWLVRKVNFERDQKEAVAEARRYAAAEEARRQAAIEAGMREAQTKWEERRAKAKERFPDFDEVFESSKDLPIAQPAVVAIQHSDRGAELTYYLATHPEEVDRLNKLAPGAIWTEMGKLEVKLELGLIGGASDSPAARPATAAGAAARVPVSNAPPPITRVGAGGGVAGINKDPDKMSHAEFKAWRAAGGGT